MAYNRKELVAQLEALKPATLTKSAVQGFSCVWMDGQNLSATNGGLGLRAPTKLEAEGGVPLALFAELLGGATADEVSVETEDSSLFLGLGGKTRVKLALMPKENTVWRYPRPAPNKKDATLELTEEMLKGLKRASIVRASTATRTEHHGVTVMFQKKSARLFSTDTRSMVCITVPDKSDIEDPLVLDFAFVDQILRHCVAGTKIIVTPEYLFVKGASVEIYTNLMDLSSVDEKDRVPFQKMIDLHVTDAKWVPLPEGFGAALGRAKAIAGAEDPIVTLKVAKKTLEIKGKFLRGNLDEELTLTKEHAPVSGPFDASSILPGLAEAEEIAISESAVSLAGGKDFVFVAASEKKK